MISTQLPKGYFRTNHASLEQFYKNSERSRAQVLYYIFATYVRKNLVVSSFNTLNASLQQIQEKKTMLAFVFNIPGG